MPRHHEATRLCQLTEVPVGWPLATVIDAFSHLACSLGISADATRAREATRTRLVELWTSQPAEADAWLEWCQECFAKELADKETRRELLFEALLRHGTAEYGKYSHNYWEGHRCRFSEAGLLLGEPCHSAAEWEEVAAWYLQDSFVRDCCRDLAELLAAAESQQTAPKRQKLEEETTERRRLEAELHKSQEEECRDLCNRLAVAEAEVSSKDAELQTAQSEAAKCKERCDELATRAAAAESALAEMWQELAQLQEEHGTCQQRCGELADRLAAKAEASEHAKTKELLAQVKSDAAEKQSEVQRLQECVSAEEAKSNVELRLEKAVLLDRCEQLRQQLAKEEGKLGQMQVLWEEKATYN